MFFDSWTDLLRIVVVGTLGYFGLLVLLRVSGKRTLSQLNSFDFVVTVAFGAVMARLLLSPDVSLAEGMTAFALLVVLQAVVTWVSVRMPLARKLVKAKPALVFYDGDFLERNMKRERVMAEEVKAIIRSHGFNDIEDVLAVVMETNGKFSVIPRSLQVRRPVLRESDIIPPPRDGEPDRRSA